MRLRRRRTLITVDAESLYVIAGEAPTASLISFPTWPLGQTATLSTGEITTAITHQKTADGLQEKSNNATNESRAA